MTLTTDDKEAAITQLEWERMMAKRDYEKLAKLNPQYSWRYHEDWVRVDVRLERQIKALNPNYGRFE